MRQSLGAKQASPLPVPVEDFQKRKVEEDVFHLPSQLRIAQQFGQDDRRQNRLPVGQRQGGRLDVGARGARKVSDQGTGVDGDQRRSSRSVLRSIENDTLPRSARNFS